MQVQTSRAAEWAVGHAGSGRHPGAGNRQAWRVFFYNAGLPENLPNINFGGPDGKVCQNEFLHI